MYMKIAKMTPYVDWLAGIYRILRVSSPNYRDDEGNADSLEVDRIMPPLYQVNLYFTKKELVELAKAARCHSSGEKSSPHAQSEDLIHYLDLFDVLRAYTDSLELGDVFQIDPLPNSEKFSHIYALADEFMNNRSGNFEICVDFCVNCKTHQTSTRHNEREIASWYNEVYKDISEEFPACDIVGNKYGPPRIGTFAAYIEGIGSDELKDKSGRLKLYKTKHGKPVSRYVLDAIYLVSYVYGNTQELARFQAEFKKDSGDDYRHPDSITTLATIGENPSKLNKKREDTLELQSDQEMYCKHWGCQNRIYILGKNHKRACRYHPGRWEFGSIHGLWPENWTCCRAEWSTPGCVFGFHQGVSNTFVRHKCINRGENNPRTLKPDSFCGRTFPDPSTCGKKYKSDSKCVYHSGHREYNERGAYI